MRALGTERVEQRIHIAEVRVERVRSTATRLVRQAESAQLGHDHAETAFGEQRERVAKHVDGRSPAGKHHHELAVVAPAFGDAQLYAGRERDVSLRDVVAAGGKKFRWWTPPAHQRFIIARRATRPITPSRSCGRSVAR